MSNTEKKSANSIWDKIVGFVAMVWLRYIKPSWSHFRWRDRLAGDTLPVPKNIITRADIQSFLNECYPVFDWTMDDITQLTDTFYPLPYIYNEYYDAKKAGGGNKFKGDCDDYHSVVWHVLNYNSIDCALITLVTKPFTKSHTMCAYKATEGGRTVYYVIDYNWIRGVYTSLEDFVNAYKLPVRYWQLDKYDYGKRKFYYVDKKKF